MFFKFIFAEEEKRTKVSEETNNFKGLLTYVKKVFNITSEDIGFLFLGNNDVSAYEICCDEDLEYVVEVTKTFENESKFINIKVIDNFNLSPENPDKFSMAALSEIFKKSEFGDESNHKSEGSILPEKINQEEVFVKKDFVQEKNDLEEVDNQIIDNFIQDKNEQEQNRMEIVEQETQELKDLVNQINDFELDEKDFENKRFIKKSYKKKIKQKKKSKNKQSYIEKKLKERKVLLKKEEDIADKWELMIEKFSKNLIKKSENADEEFKSKLNDVLNETLLSVNEQFETFEKKVNKEREQRILISEYEKKYNKFQTKINKFSRKLELLFNKIDPEFRSIITQTDLLNFQNQSTDNSLEVEMLNNLNLKLQNQIKELNEKLSYQNSQESQVYQSKPSSNKVSVQTVHMGVTCNKCKKSNFVGKRYKCLVCEDFDVCQDCEESHVHGHPMIRMINNSFNNSEVNNFLENMKESPNTKKVFNKLIPSNNNQQLNELKKAWKNPFGMFKNFGKNQPHKNIFKNTDIYIPEKYKKKFDDIGLEIVDCFDQNKSSKQSPLNPKKIDIPTKDNNKIQEEEEDFKIQSENKKDLKKIVDVKVESEFDKSFRERKEYVQNILYPNKLEDEILHFFVVENMKHNTKTFHKLVEEQKKYLVF